VSSLVLLDPLGIAPLNMLRFMAWGLPVLVGSLATGAGSRLARPTTAKPAAREQARLAPDPSWHGRSRTRLPPVQALNDDELRAVSVPVAWLIATESEAFDPHLLAARADALLPQVSTQSVPDAGHALTVSHLHICAARIAQADT
jgi:hypothetical protein